MLVTVVMVWVLPFILQLPMIIHGEPLSRICPSPESIAPCSCVHSAEGPIVTCIEAGSSLPEAVSALKGYGVAQLKIDGVEFEYAPLDMFNGLHIEDLSLSRIEVQEPLDHKNHYFQGLEKSLTTFEISKSFKSKPMSILLVYYLPRLKYVLLMDNEVPEVTKDWFSGGQSSIDTLIFERNNIKFVGDEAFASLKKLRTFALAGNTLTEVSRSMLPQPASHLTTLDLAYNKIKDIPSNFFEDMPALRNVNLNNNDLTTLSESVMSHVWNQLLEFSLEGNKLQCDHEIKWICTSKRISLTAKCQGPPEAAEKDLMDIC